MVYVGVLFRKLDGRLLGDCHKITKVKLLPYTSPAIEEKIESEEEKGHGQLSLSGFLEKKTRRFGTTSVKEPECNKTRAHKTKNVFRPVVWLLFERSSAS